MTLDRTRAATLVALAVVGCRLPAAGDAGPETTSTSSSTASTSSSSSSTTSDSTGSMSTTAPGESSDSSHQNETEGETDSETDGESETGGDPFEVVTLAYGRDPAQVLDLYLPLPHGPDPLPVLVLAHGGLWQGGSKEALGGLCREVVLAADGDIACASIGYRLSQDLGGLCSGGPATYEEQLRDFGAAVVLLQDQAQQHGLDAARVFVGGHSAGGHLAHALNLRWAEFTLGGPNGVAAIGIEGIYDIAAWDAYDASYWNGMFSCATHKAFGDPPTSPTACNDAQFSRPCWDIGSPTYLANHAAELGLVAVGNAAMIHSPGDDWVDIAEAAALGDALSAAFPNRTITVSTDGTCAVGGHNPLLEEPALAGCLVEFVRSGGTSLSP